VLEVPTAWYLGGPRVYALPAGAAGVDNYVAVPHAAVQGERTTLHLPAPGSWDIGSASAVVRAGLSTPLPIPVRDRAGGR